MLIQEHIYLVGLVILPTTYYLALIPLYSITIGYNEQVSIFTATATHLRALLIEDHGNAVGKLGLLWHRHNVINLYALCHIHAQIMCTRQCGYIFQRGGIEDAYNGLSTTDQNKTFVHTNAIGIGGATLHPLVEQAT